MQTAREAEVLAVTGSVLKSVLAVNPGATDDMLMRDLCGGVLAQIPDVTGSEVKLAVQKIAAER